MEELKDQLFKAHKDGNFFTFLRESYYEDRKNDQLIPVALSELHNNGDIDIVDTFKNYKHTSNGHDFYTIRTIFEGALPNLEHSISAVIDCIRHLISEAEHDSIPSSLLHAIKEFCRKDISRPESLYKLSIKTPDENFDLLSIALEAGAAIEETTYTKLAIDLLDHESELIMKRGISALGRIRYKDKSLLPLVIKAIEKVSNTSTSDAILATTQRALFSIASLDNSLDSSFLSFLTNHSNHAGDEYIHASAEILFLEAEKIEPNIELLLLENCQQVKPENTATIDSIDFALERILKRGDLDTCTKFLENCFRLNDYKISITSFDSLIRELINHPASHLSALITNWLGSRNIKLGRYCFDLLESCRDASLVLSVDSSLLGKNNNFRLFLARKACGWLYMRPISAVSFMLSLIKEGSQEEKAEILKLIFNPLLISYPGKLKEYFLNLDDEYSEFANDLLEKLEIYHSQMDKIIKVKELQVPIAHREAYYRKQSEEFSKSYDEAEKASFINQLGIRKSIILNGEGSVFYMYPNADQEPIRQESLMSPVTTAIDYPALTCLDPHGLDQMLRYFRLEGCIK